MSKERGNIKDAPNKQRIGQAPLNLRSAMRYASGGISDSDIGSFVQQNIGNPEAIAQAAQMYQVTAEDLARATGYSPEQISTYFSSSGVGGPYTAPQTMTPPEPTRYSPEPERPRPPDEPRRPDPNPEPRYEEPRPDPRPDPRPERPDVRPVMPEVYPQDYAGPRTTGTTQHQQVGPRTSYRQEADGTLTEIGYDGQPISGYTAQQLAMHNATTGVTPSEFQYVWNGQGYDKVRTGGITMDDGTFIAGADNGQGGMDIGGPAFFQKYADDPMTMARLREMYGFTGAEPEYQQPQIGFTPNASYQEPVEPQIGYNPMENVAPQIPFNPADIPVNGYNEPDVNNVGLYDSRQNEAEYERIDLLKRALSGQGVGSLMDSQKLTELLRSLGYSI